jgi:hypothetical protein
VHRIDNENLRILIISVKRRKNATAKLTPQMKYAALNKATRNGWWLTKQARDNKEPIKSRSAWCLCQHTEALRSDNRHRKQRAFDKNYILGKIRNV